MRVQHGAELLRAVPILTTMSSAVLADELVPELVAQASPIGSAVSVTVRQIRRALDVPVVAESLPVAVRRAAFTLPDFHSAVGASVAGNGHAVGPDHRQHGPYFVRFARRRG